MDYIIKTNKYSSLPKSDHFRIVFSTDDSKIYYDGKNITYFRLSAVDDGYILINAGYYNEDGFNFYVDELTTYTFNRDSENDVEIDGTQYYSFSGYIIDAQNYQTVYIKENLDDKTKGEKVSLDVYTYDGSSMSVIMPSAELTVNKKDTYYDGPLETMINYNSGSNQLISLEGDVASMYPEPSGDDKKQDALTAIELPNTLQVIGEKAFKEYVALTSVTIPNSVTEIDYAAFIDCTALTSITIPDSVKIISGSVFESCYNLKTIKLSENLETLGGSVFNACKSLESIIIPNSVTEIGDDLLFRCTSLKSVAMPESFEIIPRDIVYGCTALTSFTFPTNVKTIKNDAFQECYSLTSITLPNTVEVIENMAFYYCSGLTSIELSSNLQSIGSSCFRYCYNLSTVVCNATVPPTIDNTVFLNTAEGLTIYVPSESVEAYKAADNWKDLNIQSK